MPVWIEGCYLNAKNFYKDQYYKGREKKGDELKINNFYVNHEFVRTMLRTYSMNITNCCWRKIIINDDINSLKINTTSH